MPQRVLGITALCGLLAAGAAAFQDLTPADATILERKIDAVLDRGSKPAPKPAKPLRTPVSDREVNAYLKYRGPDLLPVGVVDPRIAIVDGARVELRALVDLDAVRKSKERPWTDPLSWVTGVLEIRAAGKLRAANGTGTFELESATLGGVPMPKAFLQEVVSHYSSTAESPRGFSLDQPFALPHQIRGVELQRGSAVIVQ